MITTLLINTLLVPAFAAINRLRGFSFEKPKDKKEELYNKLTSKGVMSVVAGGLGWAATSDPIVGVIVALGFLAWAVKGWGSYFMAFHGDPKSHHSNEGHEIEWIDNLVDKWLGVPKTTEETLKWGTVAMSLRGLFILPMFIALAWYLANPLILLLGVVVGLLQGPVYRSGRRVYLEGKIDVMEVIEPRMGALIGAALALSFLTLI